MLFKQTKLFQLTDITSYTKEALTAKLEPLAFTPCLPSMPFSMGWVSPVDEDDSPLVQTLNGYFMICLQIEEKILPAAVVNQELEKKITQIETNEARKVYQKEKLRLKDEMIITLLPRAFVKSLRIYAYIDSKNKNLILGTVNTKRSEQFISMFKKTFNGNVESYDMKELSHTLTHWLQHKSYSTAFAIEKSCVLQDPNQQNRVIRCQQQDLFANSIQSLIKDGCYVKQLGLEWSDCVSFVLLDNFSLQSIKFKDEVIAQANDIEAESKQQKFFADFMIMTETLSKLLGELLTAVSKPDLSPALSHSTPVPIRQAQGQN